jgi:hypothetical protein
MTIRFTKRFTKCVEMKKIVNLFLYFFIKRLIKNNTASYVQKNETKFLANMEYEFGFFWNPV